MLWQEKKNKHKPPQTPPKTQPPPPPPKEAHPPRPPPTAGPRREGGAGGGGREGGPGGPGGPGGRPRGKRQFFRKKKVCNFCVEKMALIDYKRADILSHFVRERGKILPRRMTGVCARHQR